MNQHAEIIYDCKAIALIRRWVAERCEWMVMQTGDQQICKLIEAERIGNESFRLALNRELAWVLPLTPDIDYNISSLPRMHLRHIVEKHSCSGRATLTHQLTEFYVVDLSGSQAEQILSTLSRILWVDSQVLNLGVWHDLCDSKLEYRLEHRQLKLLELSQVVSPWEGLNNSSL